jgi:endogenous inhibitor of DNA gyrase (YacG/DUF329 family)
MTDDARLLPNTAKTPCAFCQAIRAMALLFAGQVFCSVTCRDAWANDLDWWATGSGR